MHILDVVDLLDGAPFRISSFGAAAVCLLAAAVLGLDGKNITGSAEGRLGESAASAIPLVASPRSAREVRMRPDESLHR